MKHSGLLICLLASLTLSSCINIKVNTAKGEVVERTATITEDITAIGITSGISVTVDPTLPLDEIRIITHTDVQDLVKAEVEGTALSLSLHNHNMHINTLEVRIPAYNLSEISVSAGGDFEWECCTSPTLTIAASSGADAEIKGYCQSLTASASSGADLDLEELVAESVTVSASSGADATVHATSQITAVASSGADITYVGNPTIKSITTSSGASIERGN